jgi:hypothetical protein
MITARSPESLDTIYALPVSGRMRCHETPGRIKHARLVSRTAGFTHGWFTATLLTEHNVVNRHSDAQVTSAIVQLQSAGPSLTMIRRRL